MAIITDIAVTDIAVTDIAIITDIAIMDIIDIMVKEDFRKITKVIKIIL